ncbi:DUF4433 domain-containing protein [Weeksellaceae bacterium KMM 9724]|uniref:DarT ssDNA thymidine ADP-ribosyltransferase family protein n=1 Tax=Profundicola chukchiensis TaxID=2961959 RepID=UPI00243CD168|nr:DarT ssDNA thymidine ADP-ribosyltransferase family protein [Profundicola chukchiensis]MDG4950779.1 DUF4433 domain-containing protein [Profundicola chukchiensis]
MQNIFIIEPIKIRLRGYKTLFRRALPLEKYEKAILGLIHQNNSVFGFSELGAVLGFAVEDNPNLHIRKDIAEIQLFESYLKKLKTSHLIEYNSQSIQLTFWGEKAINDDCKYSFYSGNIQIPEFFDIELSNEASNFTFKEIGVDVRLTNEQNLNKAWDLAELEAPDTNLVNQFQMNRLKKNDEIIFDNIEPLSNLELIETNLQFSESNNSVNVIYESKLHEQLSKEINKDPNILKADYLKLMIRCKRLVESKEAFLIDELTDFISIIDWSEVLEKPNIIWNNNSIDLLEKFQVNWNLISSKTPVSIIQDTIDSYIEKFDWLELTNRLNIDFILENIDKYPWDVDVLTDRVTLDNFKDHFSSITKLQGIDLNSFYEQVDNEFIKQNFDQLPNITTYLSINNTNKLLEFLLEHADAHWNKTLISQKLSLSEIESNFSALKQNLNFDIVIERFITNSYDCNIEIFKETISLLSSSDNSKILNRFSKCNLSLDKLQILNNHGLIYWGNEVAPGFELNAFQDWSMEIVKTFEGKWDYDESIKYLSGNITDPKIIDELNFEWDFVAISKNSHLVNHENFFEENKSRLDVNSAIHVFEKNTLKSNLRSLFLLDQVKKIEDLPVVISRLFSLNDIIETNTNLGDLLLGISSEIDWEQIWSKTPKSFVKQHIEETFYLIESISSFSSLLTNISNCFDVGEVFELLDFGWDWSSITERAIEEGLVDDETLVSYSGYWDWEVLIKNYFDPEDLQIEGRLSEIADLISQASDEVIEKSWKLITDFYPSHSIWHAISTTETNVKFKWDWNSISSSSKISLNLNSLHRYKERINWSLLSSNSFLNGFFRYNRDIYGSRRQWENYVLSYLSEFAELWDFKQLSKLNNITRSQTIVNNFKEKWDWDILSSEKSKLLTIKNKEGVFFNERLFQKFERFINFEVISRRKDALLDVEILNKFNDKNWDWKVLSSNASLKIKKEILLNELFEKPWDWKILSNNPTIPFTNDDLLQLRDKDLDWSYFSTKEWLDNSTIIELSHKNWDWYAISSNNQLIFDQNLLRVLCNKEVVNWGNILSSKNLHCNEKTIGIIATTIKDSQEYWSTLSSNQNLSFENKILLDKYREFWDWDILIESNKIDVNSELILREYQSYINWTALSSASSFNADISILNEFKNLLDWKYVTAKIPLSDQLLEKFKSHIDWEILSRMHDFSGKLSLIKRYSEFIDFEKLENNPTIDYEISLYIGKYLEENTKARFLYSIQKQNNEWAGNAFHFTHIDNAVKIIREGRIKCRKEAEQLSDSAGNVVWSNLKPHNYARFYFRPHTQTQFYNEFLGVDIDKGYYNSMREYHSFYDSEYTMLGFPKCPIPIYFIFPLNEIFQTHRIKISSGNMQKNSTKFGYLNEMYSQFNFNDLFIYPEKSKEDWKKYRNYAQQELLIESEFDFSLLNNYKIVCHNEQHRQLLIELLGADSIDYINKIKVDSSYFRNENPSVSILKKNNTFSISTNRKAKGYFEMNFTDSNDIHNLEGDVIDKQDKQVRFRSHLNLTISKRIAEFEIYYCDENKQKWFIHANHELDNNLKDSISHLKIKKSHYLLSREKIAEHLW